MVCVAGFMHYSFTCFPNDIVCSSWADWFDLFKEMILTLLSVEYRCVPEKFSCPPWAALPTAAVCRTGPTVYYRHVACWASTCRRYSVEKKCFVWFSGSSQNSSCSSLVYDFMVSLHRWDLYCATVSSQGKSSKPLNKTSSECPVHQINSIKSSYLHLSVANARQIFQGRLVYVLYFFSFICVFFVCLCLKYERPEIVLLLMP